MITLTTVKQATSAFIKVLRFGKSDIQTPILILPPGVDSKPYKGQKGVHATTTNNSDSVFLGVSVKSETTAEGEIRIVSFDTAGTEVFVIYLKGDGTCEFGGNADNMVRYSILKQEYDKTRAVLDAILTTLSTPINEPGNGAPSAFQAAMILAVGILETGDISGSKIDKIKTL